MAASVAATQSSNEPKLGPELPVAQPSAGYASWSVQEAGEWLGAVGLDSFKQWSVHFPIYIK